MKKHISLRTLLMSFMLVLTSSFLFAQSKNISRVDEIRIKDKIKLSGLYIEELSLDSAFANPSDLKVVSQLAIKRYIDNKTATIPTTTGGASEIISTHPYLRQFRESITSSDNFDIVFIGDKRIAIDFTPLALIEKLKETREYGGYGYLSFGDYFIPPFIGGVNSGGVIQDMSGTGFQSTSGHSLTLDAEGDNYSINTTGDNGKFTNIDIWYYAIAGGGSFTITVDGVLNQTVNTAGSGVQKITISGLSDTGHNIVFEKTAGGDVVLLEYNLTRNNGGFVVHSIGNAGAKTGNFADNMLNTHFYDEVKPELVIIRLGAGGGDIVNEVRSTQNHKVFTARIKAASTNTNFIWTGETDNYLVTPTEVKAHNELLALVADSNQVACADMFSIVPEWSDFHAQGFGDLVVLENVYGAAIMADWYYGFLLNASYDQPESLPIAFEDKFIFHSDGELQLSEYGSTGSLNFSGGTIGSFPIFDTDGKVKERTALEIKTAIGVVDRWTDSGANIYRATGNVGINIDPVYPLHVDGNAVLEGSKKIELIPSNGNIYINGDAGVWINGYQFKGGSGGAMGGLFAFGSGDNYFHYSIGPVYNSNFLNVHSNGSTSIGGATAHISSKVDIQSTNKGFLFPRMTEAERDLIPAPAEGLLIYNLTTHKINVRDNDSWEVLSFD